LQIHNDCSLSSAFVINSRGYNTSIHIYQGVTEKEIDDTIFKAIYGINGLQKELASMDTIRK
jgi:hypothetical protein